MRHLPVSQTRTLAKRLLAYESAAPSFPDGAPVAFRVCEKFRRSLTMLTGAAGFRSLLQRALALTKSESASLAAVQVNANGFLECEVALKLATDDDAEGEVLLVANLIALLFTFIGEALTLRLVNDVWPDEIFESSNLEEEKNA